MSDVIMAIYTSVVSILSPQQRGLQSAEGAI